MPFKEITTRFGFLHPKITLIPGEKAIINENRESIDGRTEAFVNYKVFIADDRYIKVEQRFVGIGTMITEILHDQAANNFLENFDQHESGGWKRIIRWEAQ